MKKNKYILVMLIIFSNNLIFSQKNLIQYSGQYYHYGLHNMNGLRQSLGFQHHILDKLSIGFNIFIGSGRGKDISKDFQKDYVLMSKANFENVPNALRPYNLYYEGIYSYKRISEGLRQDNGWGISIHYDFDINDKFEMEAGLGYLSFNTKTIVRNSVMDIQISNPNSLGDTLKNHRILYPVPLYLNYKDAAIATNFSIKYQLFNELKVGLNLNFNRSFWNKKYDFGVGINIIYEF